jgi:hypothetical protein
VLDGSNKDFKVSAMEFLDRADAVILHDNEKAGSPEWELVRLEQIAGKPTFSITPPPYVTPEIVEFVRGKLMSNRSAISV